jgi:biopolymer transport protein ExbB
MDAIATEAWDAVLSLYHAGGFVILLLLLFSIVVVAVVLMKLVQFAAIRLWSIHRVDGAIALHAGGRAREALAVLARSRHPAALPVAIAIEGIDEGAEDALVREEAARLAAAGLHSLRARLRILEVIGAVAPLVGLLGTVLGLISAFQALETAGAQVSPATLSGGIWEALVTTACGLAVAIPAVMLGSWLEGFVDRAHHATEDALTRVFTQRRAPAPPEPKTALVPLGAMRHAH